MTKNIYAAPISAGICEGAANTLFLLQTSIPIRPDIRPFATEFGCGPFCLNKINIGNNRLPSGNQLFRRCPSDITDSSGNNSSPLFKFYRL